MISSYTFSSNIYNSNVFYLPLIHNIQNSYDCSVLLNKSQPWNCVKDIYVFYCDNIKLNNEEEFISNLINHNSNKNFLLIHLSIKDNHRNIIVIDYIRNHIYFFEPNDIHYNSDILAISERKKYFKKLFCNIEKYKKYKFYDSSSNLILKYRNIVDYVTTEHDCVVKGNCSSMCLLYIMCIINNIPFWDLNCFTGYSILKNLFEKIITKDLLVCINEDKISNEFLNPILYDFKNK